MLRVFTTVVKLVLELDANLEAPTKKWHLWVSAGFKGHLRINRCIKLPSRHFLKSFISSKRSIFFKADCSNTQYCPPWPGLQGLQTHFPSSSYAVCLGCSHNTKPALLPERKQRNTLHKVNSSTIEKFVFPLVMMLAYWWVFSPVNLSLKIKCGKKQLRKKKKITKKREFYADSTPLDITVEKQIH